MRRLLLTFDTENFMSEYSVQGLQLLLEKLEKLDLRGLFFITGQMAEKLKGYQNIVDLLKEHEIGYHSSSHSVHPTIFEFTDVESYKTAYQKSLIRETSHINPLSGEIEGKGGISVLHDLFPKNRIVSYRAPGYCWSPPHTEMLRDLGIKFDFSSRISPVPVCFKGLTFYPFPAVLQWCGNFSNHSDLLKCLLRHEIGIAAFHPYDFFTVHKGCDALQKLGLVHLIGNLCDDDAIPLPFGSPFDHSLSPEVDNSPSGLVGTPNPFQTEHIPSGGKIRTGHILHELC